MIRPTKSAAVFHQMVGRILRPVRRAGRQRKPFEKADALVLDVTGARQARAWRPSPTFAGLKPGSVKPGQSLADADRGGGRTEQRRVAVGAARTRQVELLRRSERHWLDADGSWVLPMSDGQVMILLAAGDVLEDSWEVWHTGKSRPADPDVPDGADPGLGARGR